MNRGILSLIGLCGNNWAILGYVCDKKIQKIFYSHLSCSSTMAPVDIFTCAELSTIQKMLFGFFNLFLLWVRGQTKVGYVCDATQNLVFVLTISFFQ